MQKIKIRRGFFLLTGLLLLIGAVALFCRKKLPDAYARYLSYNGLYSVSGQLHITHIRRQSDDRVEIAFEGEHIQPSNHFEVYDRKGMILDLQAPVLTIKMGQGEKDYHIKINSKDSCTINIDKPEIIVHSTVVSPGTLETPQVWSTFGPLVPGEQEEDAVRHYLADSMKIKPDDASEVKVKKIACFILSIIGNKAGPPSGEMARLSPVGQMRCVQAGRSRLQCGGYSTIFSFFLNKANVPCRYIEAGASLDGLAFSDHVVNEVWLKEYGCWAYADLTDGIVLVTKDGHFLNTLDIQRLLQYHPMDTSAKALHYKGDSLVSVPFEQVGVSAGNAFDHNTVFTFYYGRYRRLTSPKNIVEKITGLFSTQPYYALYSDNLSPVNSHFYLRLCSGYLFLLTALVWLVMLLRGVGRRPL
ncbi:MAG TPA: transglutaminase-like domain-containing protein [Puia sp.]|nr:transglutaminase-like domain-containing protein [Puia sp.]